MASQKRAKDSAVDAEAKALVEQEEKRKLFLAKAKILLRDDVADYEDTQDKRVSLLYEAAFFAETLMSAWRAKVNAQSSYKVGKAMSNKATMESAENALANALGDEAIAAPELRRILPQIPAGFIGARQEWQAIALLPKSFRDLIGRHLTDEENTAAITLSDMSDPSEQAAAF